MAGEGAFTLGGFETPEEIRARIGKTDESLTENRIKKIRAAESRAAAEGLGGGTLGERGFKSAFTSAERLGTAIGKAFGGQQADPPEVVQDKIRQGILKDADINSAKGLADAAKKALQAGDHSFGLYLGARALDAKYREKQLELAGAPKPEDITYGLDKDSELFGRFGVRPHKATQQQVDFINNLIAKREQIKSQLHGAGLWPKSKQESDSAYALTGTWDDIKLDSKEREAAAFAITATARALVESGEYTDAGEAQGKASQIVHSKLVTKGIGKKNPVAELWDHLSNFVSGDPQRLDEALDRTDVIDLTTP